MPLIGEYNPKINPNPHTRAPETASIRVARISANNTSHLTNGLLVQPFRQFVFPLRLLLTNGFID